LGLEFREQEGAMASEGVVRKQDEIAVEAPETVYVKRDFLP
jgi:hypothetical protein